MCSNRTKAVLCFIIIVSGIFLTILTSINENVCTLGSFPCDNDTKCIQQSNHCDGMKDCEDNSDEGIGCGVPKGSLDFFVDNLKPTKTPQLNTSYFNVCGLYNVPENCTCNMATSVFCKSTGLTKIPIIIDEKITYLVLQNNHIKLRAWDFGNYSSLWFLSLTSNRISRIENGTFNGLRNLKELYLSDNLLRELPLNAFSELDQLEILSLSKNDIEDFDLKILKNSPLLNTLILSHNRLSLSDKQFEYVNKLSHLDLSWNNVDRITEFTFKDLTLLTSLFLDHNRIIYIHPRAFHYQAKLIELNISYTDIKIPPGLFSRLENLEWLILTDVEVHNISKAMFMDMPKLDKIDFKRFRYCSFVPKVRNCKPNSDGISSLDNLLANPLLRVSVWMVAIITCVGNTMVIMGRIVAPKKDDKISIYVKNLAAGDFLMGIYLVIIAIHDTATRNHYNRYANNWMHSWQCSLTGILAMMGSETSLLILCLISVDRFLHIWRRPETFHLTSTTKGTGIFFVWVAGAALALVPVLYWSGENNFYGGNSMCVPLHIDDPFMLGWEYSASIFIGLNSTMLVLIGVMYGGIFVSVWRSRRKTTSQELRRVNDIAVRVFLIVLTDCLCWIPIICLKLVAIFHFPISADLYAWVMVLILPINSAINPCLYTFTSPESKILEKIKCYCCQVVTGNGTRPDSKFTRLTTWIGFYRSSRLRSSDVTDNSTTKNMVETEMVISSTKSNSGMPNVIS